MDKILEMMAWKWTFTQASWRGSLSKKIIVEELVLIIMLPNRLYNTEVKNRRKKLKKLGCIITICSYPFPDV
jgi:hypothetical protein